ncbi:hypothetical protein [Comamonas endophytica]|uniref:NlpE C-terminal OB domain-containing protein n=1 Tax=Comamonas endophytica TaxID=2949090 RepID=A0ABY6GAG6_9BURK|nr:MULTISPECIES: hypothetical protein [unclassified Acidovorax]MCD2513940.1 hypothetical protein [Acidovorax sp. D4N7]UYG51715.1 hypothetical protein M9799_00175 [Acidovorax sp. 5MLIR]UYG52066.1 hypothetical protein M9799_02130 [Acidovorax sp. 5MLIR]
MHFPPLRIALLTFAAALSGCSYVSEMRMPSMPSLPSWISSSTPAPVAPAMQPAALQPTDKTETWRGTYRQHGDAARFTECRSGAEMPVAQAGDKALLDAAYLASQSAPGAPLLVEVQGRWVLRARADAPPSAKEQELALLVERFVSVSSQGSCAGW